jgi:proline dehydrogenase
LWRVLRGRGVEVGVVLQAALRRTPRDLEEIIEGNGSVRLCKGAYAEPDWVAYPDKSDVDHAYSLLLERLLRYAADRPTPPAGSLPTAAIATHDERLIRSAVRQIRELDLPIGSYEFQMLYGVRRTLQDRLLESGYPVRIYTPWGPFWYPYLSRRMAERPANVWFVLRALWHDRFGPKRSVSDQLHRAAVHH